jgi:phosphotransferase system IIA component
VDKNRRRARLGVIIRNSSGGVVAMLCETIDHILDLAIAESLAARRGAELGLSLGLRKVILEGDALEIVGILNKEGGSRMGSMVRC